LKATRKFIPSPISSWAMRTLTIDQRIEVWKKRSVFTAKGCWLYQGAHAGDNRAYGSVSFEGKERRLHLLVWEHLNGPVPAGHELDHICHEPACWNPSHLEPVTHRENCHRGLRGQVQRKTHCPRGHRYTETNTYTNPRNGWRQCRTCHNARNREGNRK